MVDAYGEVARNVVTVITGATTLRSILPVGSPVVSVRAISKSVLGKGILLVQKKNPNAPLSKGIDGQ